MDSERCITTSWTTICLFLATALASQLCQDTIRKREEKQWIQTRQRYHHKRLAERMSYDDLQDYLDEYSDDERLKNNGQGSHHHHQQQQQQQQTNKELVSPTKSSGDLDKENEFDFHPKNNNWSHFEETIEPNAIEENEEDNDSSSSEEAFLWTTLTRRKSFVKDTTEIAPQHNTENLEAFSWSDKIRQLQIGLESFMSTTDEYDGGVLLVNENKRREENSASDLKQAAPNHRYAPELTPIDSLAHHNQAVRAQYNAHIMPNKVVMVRHGQSEGNVDDHLYSTIPDNAMRLTKLGWEQAIKIGQVLKERVIVTGESVHFIVSPYVRTVETFHGIVSAWCDPSVFNHIKCREKRVKAWYGHLLSLGLTWHEDPRIREQDFGNYQDPAEIKRCKDERHKFGAFFYRFPHGESASDVFDRVSTFLDSLWRSFDLNKSRNYVLITHGISIRVLLARYFRYSIDQFSTLANPRNCEMVILGHDGAGKLRLDGRCELELEVDEATRERRVTGHHFQRRLRVLPKEYVHKIKVRVSSDDYFEDRVGPLLEENDSARK